MHIKAPLEGRFSFGLLFGTLGAILFLIGWLAPNHYPPWTSFHNEAFMFAALLALCFAATTSAVRVALPRWPFLFFAGTVAIVWLQVANGLISYSGDAFVISIYIAGFGLAWWLGARSAIEYRQSQDGVSWLAILLVIAASVSAFFAVLQWLRLETLLGIFVADRGPGMRPYGNLAQPNNLATLLIMGIVCSYLLWLLSIIKLWQLVGIGILISFGLVVTESRTGLLSAIIFGLFILLYCKPIWNMHAKKVVTAWWTILLFFASIWSWLNEALLLQPAREAIAAKNDGRLVIWKQILSAISQSPWVGYGWRQTIVAQKAGAQAAPGDLPTDYAHNVVLDLWAWIGIPAGTLFLLAVAWWVFRTFRNIRNSTDCLLFAVAIPFFVHSLLEFPFAYAYFLLTMGWLFGVLHALQKPEQYCVVATPSWTFRALLAGVVVLYATLCGWVAIEYLNAEEDCRVMRFELRKVGANPVGYAPPRLVLLNQLDEMLKMGRLKPFRGMPVQDLERMRRANASLAWAALHLNYVIALGLNGQPEEASRQLKTLRALYGDETYRQAVDQLRKSREVSFPELALVNIS